MPSVSIMIKPASSQCNLACKYCFYRDVASHREEACFGLMTREISEMLVRKALDYANGELVSFVFQGGEPMLAGIDYFKYFVSCVNELNKKKSHIYYGMQTNGTLITDEWADFFAKNNFLIGLSLDGDFKYNEFRIEKNGCSTFSAVMSCAKILENHNVDFNVLTVLTGLNAKNAESVYNFFKSSGFHYLQFVPCLRPFGSNEESELYMTTEQYADFLIKAFNFYVRDYENGDYVSVRQFDNWVRLFLRQPAEQCGMSGCCSVQFVCESSGNIYPCDFYCTDEYLLGNICDADFYKLSSSETAKHFVRESMIVPDKCKSCSVYRLCRAGGCKRIKESADYCAAYKKFFEECLPLFKRFLNI